MKITKHLVEWKWTLLANIQEIPQPYLGDIDVEVEAIFICSIEARYMVHLADVYSLSRSFFVPNDPHDVPLTRHLRHNRYVHC